MWYKVDAGAETSRRLVRLPADPSCGPSSRDKVVDRRADRRGSLNPAVGGERLSDDWSRARCRLHPTWSWERTSRSSSRTWSTCTGARSATTRRSARSSRSRRTPSSGPRCKISSHTFICEGVTIEDEVFVGHGVMFINDLYPRATTPAERSQTEADWKVVPTLVKRGASIGERCHDPRRRHDRRGRPGRRGSRGDADVPDHTIVAGVPAPSRPRRASDNSMQASGAPQEGW